MLLTLLQAHALEMTATWPTIAHRCCKLLVVLDAREQTAHHDAVVSAGMVMVMQVPMAVVLAVVRMTMLSCCDVGRHSRRAHEATASAHAACFQLACRWPLVSWCRTSWRAHECHRAVALAGVPMKVLWPWKKLASAYL
jgi:hypothetical protein